MGATGFRGEMGGNGRKDREGIGFKKTKFIHTHEGPAKDENN